jgi:vanillate O-demethylase monooxygenase subunit
MADFNTPFVFDCWYVAAFASELEQKLLARTILGKRLVLYRTTSGEPVALDDRCAHRSFPLSKSRLEADTIVCGYHGFRYDSSGNCIQVPSLPKCPATIGVRAYPLVERGPVVWIWMGDPDTADETKIPPLDWTMSPEWTLNSGYIELPASYIGLHENLLDLTHIEFLHSETLGAGAPGYSLAPYKTEIGSDTFALLRTIEPTSIPGPFVGPMGFTDVATGGRAIRSAYVTPGYHQLVARYYDASQPVEQRRECVITTAHLPTPATQTSTHYFIVNGRNFALDDSSVTKSLHDGMFEAFAEDVWGLGQVQKVLNETPLDELYEMSVKSDSAAVAMRRHIRSLALRDGHTAEGGLR